MPSCTMSSLVARACIAGRSASVKKILGCTYGGGVAENVRTDGGGSTPGLLDQMLTQTSFVTKSAESEATMRN